MNANCYQLIHSVGPDLRNTETGGRTSAMTPARRPVGRPPVADEKRREHRTNFRTTEAEAVTLKRAAAERGLTVTDYLRGLIAADNAMADA